MPMDVSRFDERKVIVRWDVELDTVLYVSERRRSKLIEMLVQIVFRTNRNLKVKHFRLTETLEEALDMLDIKVTS